MLLMDRSHDTSHLLWSLLFTGATYRTTEQQQRFHEICRNLVMSRHSVQGWWKRLLGLKDEKPKVVRRVGLPFSSLPGADLLWNRLGWATLHT